MAIFLTDICIFSKPFLKPAKTPQNAIFTILMKLHSKAAKLAHRSNLAITAIQKRKEKCNGCISAALVFFKVIFLQSRHISSLFLLTILFIILSFLISFKPNVIFSSVSSFFALFIFRFSFWNW